MAAAPELGEICYFCGKFVPYEEVHYPSLYDEEDVQVPACPVCYENTW